MIGFERDEDLAVRGADGGVIAKSEVDALRYTNVIDNCGKVARWDNLPDEVFNARKNLLAFLKPCTRRRVDVEAELTAKIVRRGYRRKPRRSGTVPRRPGR